LLQQWNKALLPAYTDNSTIYEELFQQQIKAPGQEDKLTEKREKKRMQLDGCSRQH
jgi:hypothetical protein